MFSHVINAFFCCNSARAAPDEVGDHLQRPGRVPPRVQKVYTGTILALLFMCVFWFVCVFVCCHSGVAVVVVLVRLVIRSAPCNVLSSLATPRKLPTTLV